MLEGFIPPGGKGGENEAASISSSATCRWPTGWPRTEGQLALGVGARSGRAPAVPCAGSPGVHSLGVSVFNILERSKLHFK